MLFVDEEASIILVATAPGAALWVDTNWSKARKVSLYEPKRGQSQCQDIIGHTLRSSNMTMENTLQMEVFSWANQLWMVGFSLPGLSLKVCDTGLCFLWVKAGVSWKSHGLSWFSSWNGHSPFSDTLWDCYWLRLPFYPVIPMTFHEISSVKYAAGWVAQLVGNSPWLWFSRGRHIYKDVGSNLLAICLHDHHDLYL